ncbi:hypothetical protein [Winogradskyella psychrotolerans]|uniref:hypothetical protein n=1 Tax=Winogradskyella psychrotolerans TaxID=1344585 RepID=UPI0005946544|nr:hypothetical protein [Winogradskyella psychrotolerans]
MKKAGNIILICVLIFLVGLFIHPKKVIYEPKIIGQVVDRNGNPIQNAIVARIEENEIKIRNSDIMRAKNSNHKSLRLT